MKDKLELIHYQASWNEELIFIPTAFSFQDSYIP